MSQRRAGVLLHITSLPATNTHGDISKHAFEFVDQLSQAGFSVWQILPLGPTHADLCPYQSLSAHAGNPQLINLQWLHHQGWLKSEDMPTEGSLECQQRIHCIHKAYQHFKSVADTDEENKFQAFIKENSYWLVNYALFMSLRDKFENRCWIDWPAGYRDFDENTLNEYAFKNKDEIQSIYFQQYVFFRQWLELKAYANNKGILIIGDMPIFVSHDSAEVWANRKYFAINQHGMADFVAGVPPDYFSEYGQRWGNPHYQWDKLLQDDFSWWVERMKTQSMLYDGIRIDHFRGLVQYWEIPASEDNAINGRWVDAPGEALLKKLTESFPDFALIAEDLGTITPDVTALRNQFSMPGMLILQFAFSGDSDNPYLPVNHAENSVVYTATHDNDTTVNWYQTLSPEVKSYVGQCLGEPSLEMPWALIQVAFDSVARLAVIPMQDLLSLGAGHRMNTPGTVEGNWQWQLEEAQFTNEIIAKASQMLISSGRACKRVISYDSSQVI